MSAPPVHDRAGNILDFRRLHPTSFSRSETLLWLVEWLIDMEKLFNMARIPQESQVDIMKI